MTDVIRKQNPQVKKTVINANYPPEGTSRKKLEEIWGDGKDIVPLRERNFDAKRKHKFEPSPSCRLQDF